MVGIVTLVVSAASYGVAQMLAASPVTDSLEGASASVGVTAASGPLLLQTLTPLLAMIDAVPDALVLLVTGVALIGLAAGLRRHAPLS